MGIVHDPEAIGLMALGFLAGRADDLGRFLDSTGLTASGLRAAASEPGTARAALVFVMAHEPTAAAFAADSGLSADAMQQALAKLEGGWDRGAA
jgi:hypothetical protein